MDISNEFVILSSLANDEEFARKCLVHIKEEYFQDETQRVIFETIRDYIQKYQTKPSKIEVGVSIRNDRRLNEGQTELAVAAVEEVFEVQPHRSMEWLVETTENWCKNQAVYNAIHESIAIYQGEDKTRSTTAIPDLLKTAISVCFDTKVGLDFYTDVDSRWEFYTNPENKLPFHLDILNEVTDGGVTKKTLNLLVAGTNVGKTLGLIDMAAGYVKNGIDVLYISAEMREEMIMKRFDANMLKTPINDIASLGKEKFINRIETIRSKSYGRFKVKEYPPGACTAVHIRNVVDELKIRQGFVPQVIVVDYLQIMGSYRVKFGAVGSYYYYKAVAEELRALGVELDVAMWSAAQFNRGGMNATEVGMEDVAESVGIMFTVDGAWGLIRTDELDQVNQIQWKQLKSRYADKSVRTRFVTGVDVPKSTFYDVSQSQQDEVSNPEQAERTTQDDLRRKFGSSEHTKSRFGGME